MAWKMSFDYDEQHDVVTASFQDCVLNSARDVERWRTEVERFLSRYPSKVDLLINLDGLVVKYMVGRVFGRERSEVLARYSRRSFRYGGDETTRMFINSSSATTGMAANIYPSRDEALKALLADRAAVAETDRAASAMQKVV